MALWKNIWHGQGLQNSPITQLAYKGEPRYEALPRIHDYLSSCPFHAPTPMQSADWATTNTNVGQVLLKDERNRHGLGSFKALGGAYAVATVILDYAHKYIGDHISFADLSQPVIQEIAGTLTFICASAGNHGLSVASGARRFGAKARIFVSNQVPSAFEERLQTAGAETIRAGDTYEESLMAAEQNVRQSRGILIPDAANEGCLELPKRVMEGYLAIAPEVAEDLKHPPTHIFLQAGVGGFAAAMAAAFRYLYSNNVCLIIVEPDKAPCLQESIKAGHITSVSGGASNMGRLDCKEPSLSAFTLLAREADFLTTISDEEADKARQELGRHKLPTTPSGGAGFAAIQKLASNKNMRAQLGLSSSSRILAFLTEGPLPTNVDKG